MFNTYGMGTLNPTEDWAASGDYNNPPPDQIGRWIEQAHVRGIDAPVWPGRRFGDNQRVGLGSAMVDIE